ncbi:hypothetical protein BamMEX5DRAFT_7059 [Burkholderia ambifaria MEX-5]|uniref:Bacterial Ig-like domain-containing protein n=2 Tax=Burkholderia ambifaria TaxID=152480 RepID=B1TGZ3_9BURK|nr:hypothetical protein BamMEX5DRAFT_7059 [Burkholderia ambifaria MEX-5]
MWVLDDQGIDIPNGGSTVSTSVTLTGTASPGQRVQILDGSTPVVYDVPVENTGYWTMPIPGLDVAGHYFTAVGQYANNPPSNTREVIVYSGAGGREDWENQPDHAFTTGHSVTYPSGLVVTLAFGESAPAFGGTQVRRLNLYPGRGLTLVGNAQIRLNFPGMIRYFRGTVVAIHGTANYAVFFDPRGTNIGTLALPVTGDGYQTVEFRATAGTVIAAIDIVSARDPGWPTDVGWSIADVQWLPYI